MTWPRLKILKPEFPKWKPVLNMPFTTIYTREVLFLCLIQHTHGVKHTPNRSNWADIMNQARTSRTPSFTKHPLSHLTATKLGTLCFNKASRFKTQGSFNTIPWYSLVYTKHLPLCPTQAPVLFTLIILTPPLTMTLHSPPTYLSIYTTPTLRAMTSSLVLPPVIKERNTNSLADTGLKSKQATPTTIV